MPESKGFLVVKRIIFIFLVIILSLIYRETRHVSGGMSDYCYVPANISQTVPPNVLLIIDVSGSMRWCAYNPKRDRRDCCNSTGCGWTYREDEEGYFEPDAVYEYKRVSVGSKSNVYAWVKSSETTYDPCPERAYDINATKKYKGSCLNFHYMRRIDLVRWALTGGTLASCPTGVDVNNPQFNRCNPMAYNQPGNQTSCNGTGCLLKTYGGVYVFASWERITGTEGGILFQFKRFNPQPRVGLMEY
ncbi:MAG: pilus assembly protein PilY, partial [Caldimicrobium thiodismutans]